MNLICACCGGESPSRAQWWNQDTGYGICPRCFERGIDHETRVLGNVEARAEALFAYGWPGRHHTVNARPSLYYAVLACRIKHASHETDLYLPITEQTTKLLKQFPLEDGNKTTFINQVEGGRWYDVPFSYLPAWEAKEAHV